MDNCFYGECKSQPKCSFGVGTSLGNFAINTKHKCLVFAMYHNHTWYGKSFDDHFKNEEIFISFPISCTQFLQGNFVPCYVNFHHEMKTAYNDLKWLLPPELCIINWDMQTHYFNLKPILNNHYGCKDQLSKFMTDRLKLLHSKITAMQAKVQVCFCIYF